NRRAKQGDPTKPFVVIEPDGKYPHLPYTPADLDAARSWCDKLPPNDISQQHLAELWEQSAEDPPHLVRSAWLDGGPATTVNELRETSPGITGLMPDDVFVVRVSPKRLGRLALPMPPPPRSVDWRRWDMLRGLPIAEPGAIIYDQ